MVVILCPLICYSICVFHLYSAEPLPVDKELVYNLVNNLIAKPSNSNMKHMLINWPTSIAFISNWNFIDFSDYHVCKFSMAFRFAQKFYKNGTISVRPAQRVVMLEYDRPVHRCHGPGVVAGFLQNATTSYRLWFRCLHGTNVDML